MANARQFLAVRTSLVGGGAGWKNPYVTDGLVAMWDGEWNAGGGVHDATVTVWRDISGNGFDMLIGRMPFRVTDKSFVIEDSATSGNFATSSYKTTATKDLTISMVFRYPVFSPTWSIRFWGGLFYDHKSGFGPVARGRSGNKPEIKYSASYSDSSDRYIGLGVVSSGQIVSSTIVFTRETKSFSGFIGGQNVGSIGSQADNWIGDDTPLTARLVYNQLAQQIGGEIEIYNMCIYERALTTEEIAQNYAIDKARFGLP